MILIECPDAVKAYTEGADVALDIDEGKVIVNGEVFTFPPLPKEIIAIRDAGGLLPYVRQKLKQKR